MRFIFPIILAVLGIAVLLWLGVWQRDRLDEKTAYLADINTRMVAEPVALPIELTDADNYLRVQVVGQLDERLDGREIHVLRGDKLRGAGFRIIAPVTIRTASGARRIMVDLGFVRTGDKNMRRAGQVAVIGNVFFAMETGRNTPPPDLDAGIWFARDTGIMADFLDTEPILVVASAITALDTDAQNWQAGMFPQALATNIPNDHWEYMVTWFSLAAVWGAMSAYWIGRLWRRRV